MTTIFEIPVNDIDGKANSLAEYKGKVLLIVNVASKCGFTNQYEGLQNLQSSFESQGFTVLAFPCNQFGGQEPGNSEEIKSFCEINYKTTFPLFEKLEVNGDNTHPLFKILKERAPGVLGTEAIKWNFTKFLVDRTGNKIKRFAPTTTPEALKEEIEKLLRT